MTLPKDNPTAFCKAFIARELEENRKQNIWMSCWPVMERLMARADELGQVFNEIVDRFGYIDKYEGYPPSNAYVWLILEHIWFSFRYCREEVVNSRGVFNELAELNETIIEQSLQLARSLRRQSELYESSDFQRPDYQSVTDMLEWASKDNFLFKSHLSPELGVLSHQYDLKYWPSRAEMVEAIADFESSQPKPKHQGLPDAVINGRVSDIKD